MRLNTEQSRELLEKHGCYITEICDKCGRGVGAARYTRVGDGGLWCSRKCRGDNPRVTIRTGGRPRKYSSREECRAAKTRQQRDYRESQCGKKPIAVWRKQRTCRRKKRLSRNYPLGRVFGGFAQR
jgi:hypothetical protein